MSSGRWPGVAGPRDLVLGRGVGGSIQPSGMGRACDTECAGQGDEMGCTGTPGSGCLDVEGLCGCKDRRGGISQTVGPQQDVWVPVLTVLWVRERQQVGSLPNLLLGVWDACLSPMSLTLHGQRGGVLDKATHCGPWGRGCHGLHPSSEGLTAPKQCSHAVDFPAASPFSGTQHPKLAWQGRLPEVSQAR